MPGRTSSSCEKFSNAWWPKCLSGALQPWRTEFEVFKDLFQQNESCILAGPTKQSHFAVHNFFWAGQLMIEDFVVSNQDSPDRVPNS